MATRKITMQMEFVYDDENLDSEIREKSPQEIAAILLADLDYCEIEAYLQGSIVVKDEVVEQ